jgi:hypothetical protein
MDGRARLFGGSRCERILYVYYVRSSSRAYARVSKALHELGIARRCAVTGHSRGTLGYSGVLRGTRGCPQLAAVCRWRNRGGGRRHVGAPVASSPASNRLLLLELGFPAYIRRRLLALPGLRPAGRRHHDARSAFQAGLGRVLLFRAAPRRLSVPPARKGKRRPKPGVSLFPAAPFRQSASHRRPKPKPRGRAQFTSVTASATKPRAQLSSVTAPTPTTSRSSFSPTI